MLDMRDIRKNPEAIRAAARKKGAEIDLDALLENDARPYMGGRERIEPGK